MNGTPLDLLKQRRADLENVEPWPWRNILNWAMTAHPLFAEHFERHYENFKGFTAEPKWIQGKGPNTKTEAARWEARNREIAAHAKKGVLGFLENVILVNEVRPENVGTTMESDQSRKKKTFIGHGGSPIWLVLKEFLRDELHLDCEEFNSEPQAGHTNIARLQEMLDGAIFAFLVMTGEDKDIDGKSYPRKNVIHEAGLFQGRLGFNKAIILLEDGCERFSNIDGLTYIDFRPNRISDCFDEVRRVLKQRKIIP